MTNKAPQYNLKDVKAAANTGNVNMSRTAERDALELGYDSAEVIRCLQSLSANDFDQVKKYRHNKYFVPCDVYRLSYSHPSGKIDDLYIKFRYLANWITVMSFHLQRYG